MKKIVLLLILALLVAGCTQTQPPASEDESPEEKATPTPEEIEMVVKQGDRIKVDYTGKLEDGTVFDSSDGREPLEFNAGTGKMIKGFDAAVIGMKEGEEKTITLKPEEAYGQVRKDLIFDVPKENIAGDIELAIGTEVTLIITGKPMSGRITDVLEDSVKVDLNPKLAGKTLVFDIKIVEIVE